MDLNHDENDDDIQLPPLPTRSIYESSRNVASKAMPAIPTVNQTIQSGEISSQFPKPKPEHYLCRKRPRFQSEEESLTSITTSSDPALFSGDEQSDHAENYSNNTICGESKLKRKKKQMYAGSWWNHRKQARKSERKREFKRNLDSGIFMGSEDSSVAALSSDSLADELLEHQLAKEEENVGNSSAFWRSSMKASPGSRSAVVRQNPTNRDDIDPPELQQAKRIIKRCLDEAAEVIDLSSLRLCDLPAELSYLKTLTKTVHFVPGMLNSGTSLEPNLQLYLANNILCRVPRPILDLHNLRVLSLRQNKLTSIPPGIGQLKKLQELNISGNLLQTLPFEIFELVAKYDLTDIVAHPNPWLPALEVMNKDTQVLVSEYKETEPVRNSPRPHSISKDTRIIMMSSESLIRNTRKKSISNMTPSLTEMVLRQIAKINSKVDLVALMPKESTPQTVVDALRLVQPYLDNFMDQNDEVEYEEESANKPVDYGTGLDRRCTTCYRQIVQPGRSWIEWWMWSFQCGLSWTNRPEIYRFGYDDGEKGGLRGQWSYVPFIRMQCHELCQGKENPIFIPPPDDVKNGDNRFSISSNNVDDPKKRESISKFGIGQKSTDEFVTALSLVNRYTNPVDELMKLRPELLWNISVRKYPI